LFVSSAVAGLKNDDAVLSFHVEADDTTGVDEAEDVPLEKVEAEDLETSTGGAMGMGAAGARAGGIASDSGVATGDTIALGEGAVEGRSWSQKASSVKVKPWPRALSGAPATLA
jgi:hypothetical protein